MEATTAGEALHQTSGASAGLPRAEHSYEDWFRAPVPLQSSDPRFEVRRARLDEFEAIYDLVPAKAGQAPRPYANVAQKRTLNALSPTRSATRSHLAAFYIGRSGNPRG